MADPTQGEVYDGYRYLGGDPKSEASWEQAAPVAAPEYGNGAQRLPNGDIVRYGPQGGMTVLEQGGSDGIGKLTEDQGKSGDYARDMADAEMAYRQALDEGFNPTGFTAGLANFTDNVPGLGGVGNFIRDDAGDKARQAELQWTDARLKAKSGAASPEQEVVRNNITYFARPGQNFDSIGDRLEQARRTAFTSTKIRAGAAARDVNYPDASGGAGSVDPRTGLPIYPGISETIAGVNGGQGPADIAPPERPQGPGSGPDSAIDYRDPANREALAGLIATGGWLRDGSGQPYQVGPGGIQIANPNAGDQQVSSGVFQRPQSPTETVAERRDMNGIARRVDAGVRGAADTLTFGLADEIAAGLNTVIPLDPGMRSGFQDGFGEAYRNNVETARAVDQADAKDVPLSRGVGQVAGALAPGAVLARGAGAVVRPLAQQAARGAAAGAAFGGAYGLGSGQGNALERAPNAAMGAVGGAVIGGAAAPVANVLANRVAAPAVNALQSAGRFAGRQVGRATGNTALVERASPNALQSGIDRFASRSPQDINALNANAARFRGEEIQPTFADTVNDGGRGTMRALATRQTPARQAAREFADGRAVGLQDRVSTQARRTVSADPRQPAEIRQEITTRRNAQADQQFGAVRNEVVTPDEAVVSALRAPATRTAIDDAANEAANFGDIETANALRQLTGEALDNPAGVEITVGMSDRLARTLNGRAEAAQRSGNNTQAASLFSLAERLRGTARQQVPGYDEALKGYAQDSGLVAATDLGEQFTRMEADQFAAQAGRLSPEQRTVAQAAARRAIERDAGTQGQAPGVAARLAGGREQAQRSAALLDNPDAMQRGMRTELEALRNAQAVSPSQGSQTSMNLQDAGNAAGVIGGLRDVATGNGLGVISRIASGIKSRGFSDQEAEALVQAAIDPQQTDQVIAMLAQRMSRREARNLARALRYQVTTSLQSGQQN